MKDHYLASPTWAVAIGTAGTLKKVITKISWEKVGQRIKRAVPRLLTYVRLLVIVFFARFILEVLRRPKDFWPSSHTWNQIMFASVLVLVALGIVALTIFIVRNLRS